MLRRAVLALPNIPREDRQDEPTDIKLQTATPSQLRSFSGRSKRAKYLSMFVALYRSRCVGILRRKLTRPVMSVADSRPAWPPIRRPRVVVCFVRATVIIEISRTWSSVVYRRLLSLIFLATQIPTRTRSCIMWESGQGSGGDVCQRPFEDPGGF